MLMWLDYCKTILKNEKGQGMVEYGLILGLPLKYAEPTAFFVL